MTHANQAKRPALNTQDSNAIRIVYRAKLDPRMKTYLCIAGIVNPCSGLFCKKEEAYDQSYVQIHENRVEVGLPSMFQCCLCLGPCSQINDYVEVYYFDRRLAEAATRSGFCKPICLPCGLNPMFGGYVPPLNYFGYPCCPTCFDMCGQGVTLHGKIPICCCHNFATIPFLEDANAFIDAFDRAKTAHMGGNAAPSQQTMA